MVGFLVNGQKREVFSDNLTTLIFSSDESEFDKRVKKKLVKTFFEAYPKMMKDFNPEATDPEMMSIDTVYTGVGYAHNGQKTISSEWLNKK